jgi:hypothetical protein
MVPITSSNYFCSHYSLWCLPKAGPGTTSTLTEKQYKVEVRTTKKMLQTLGLGRLAEKLILAAEADDNDDSGTMHTPQNSSSAPASGFSTSNKTLIPLKNLFIYPSDPAAPTELEFYWKGGITKLEEMLVAYELLSEMARDSNDLDNARVDNG